MAHITEFEIEGLAGRKNPLKAVLNRDVNVFFGLNGSGKTSLLKILRSAMTGDASPLARVPFNAAIVKIYSINYDRIFTYSLTQEHKRITKSGDATSEAIVTPTITHRKKRPTKANEHPSWIITPEIPGKGITNWQHRYQPTTRLYMPENIMQFSPFEFESNRSNSTGLTEEQLNKMFERTIQSLWSTYSAQVLGTVRMAQEKGIASMFRAVISAKSQQLNSSKWLNSRIAYDKITAFLSRQGSKAMSNLVGSYEEFEKRYKEEPTLRNIVIDINTVENEIDAANAPRKKFQDLLTKMLSNNKKVKFEDNTIKIISRDGTNIGLDLLSSGEKQIIRLFIEIILAEGNTILIDEPEISMHVDWQDQFVSAAQFLNPHAQLILATHSPEIMADIPDEKVFKI
jgi:predicted ATP-dependent endonuclease of OLD family